MSNPLYTPLCKRLGIDYPIIQGGMVHVATWELSAAVSEAGGLGVLGCGNFNGAWLADQVDALRAKTNKPFAANLLLLSPHIQSCIDVVLEKDVKIVTFGAGIPRKEIPRLREAGVLTLPLVGSPRLARIYEKLQADAVIAEGMEAGGEIGDLTTMTLVPMVASASRLPVVAAGGIADGRGLVAALALGAQAIQMGTRFVATKECVAHPNAKAMILKARDRDTAVAGYASGNPIRSIRNALVQTIEEMDRDIAAIKDDGEKRAAVMKMIEWGVGATRKGLIDGDTEKGSVLAGQISGMIDDLPSAGDIVRRMMEEAREVLRAIQRS